MNLQTVVDLGQPAFQFGYADRLMMIGSCFVENMGEKMMYYKFRTDINPCGIVYNPSSVYNTLAMLLGEELLSDDELVCKDGRWVSLLHHGRFSASTREECLSKINKRIRYSQNCLKNTDVLIITWGTAWVYSYRKTGTIVSNCHKLPASEFERLRMGVEELVIMYERLFKRLKNIRPGLKVLFTVSPIRHWKDGAHENQLSKSILLLAIEELCVKFDFVSYFPSYEIVMDELRDYRFYAEDMLHISPQGVNYIWEKFSNLYIDKKSRQYMAEIERMMKILKHRVSDATSPDFLDLRKCTEHELFAFLHRIYSSR